MAFVIPAAVGIVLTASDIVDVGTIRYERSTGEEWEWSEWKPRKFLDTPRGHGYKDPLKLAQEERLRSKESAAPEEPHPSPGVEDRKAPVATEGVDWKEWRDQHGKIDPPKSTYTAGYTREFEVPDNTSLILGSTLAAVAVILFFLNRA